MAHDATSLSAILYTSEPEYDLQPYVFPGLHPLQIHIRHGGTVAQVLALPPHSKKVLGSIPAWVLPRSSVLRWAISRAFLCVVCMFSLCSQGVSSSKNPNRKNMQNNRTHVHP